MRKANIPTTLACLGVMVGGIGLLAPAPVMADTAVGFDYTAMGYSLSSSGDFVVTDTSGSVASLDMRSTPGPIILDWATISGGSFFDVFVDLDITGGSGSYSASGTFRATDTATGTSAMLADFESATVSLIGDLLIIEGGLSTQSGEDSILVNRGNPWVYAGVAGDTANSPDSDGTDGTITIDNTASYDNGNLWVLQFSTGYFDIDELFSFAGPNRTGGGGNVKGNIVPVPGALLLGAMGLGMVGWMRRRSTR